MIILSETTDKLEAVLGGSVTTNQLECYTSWRDRTSTTFVAGRTVINTNNTTDVTIAGSPASSTQRVIDYISIYNDDTVSQTVTVKLDANGTEYILYKGVLTNGATLTYVEGTGWTNTSNNLTPLLNNKFVITGALYETFDRNLCDEVNTAVLSSGRLSLQAIWLPANTTINSISFWSATTAGATLTNQLFGLYDNNLNLLRSSNNDTSTAWAANSKKTLSLTSAFTTTYSGLHYLGIMVAATTVPTLKGNTAKTGGQLGAAAPSMGGTSNTGLTTALPATATAPGTVTTSFWGCVS
jgi:hypothetical protein